MKNNELWTHTKNTNDAWNTHENKREIQHIIIIVIGWMLCMRAAVCLYAFFSASFRIFDILQIIHLVVYKKTLVLLRYKGNMK